MEIIEFYKKLFTAPDSISTFGQYTLTTLVLLLPCLLLLWFVAMGLYFLLRSNREELGSTLAVRFGWAWACVALGTLLFADIVVLWILARLTSWSASSPHLSLAVLGGLVGILVYLGARRELKNMQRAVFQ